MPYTIYALIPHANEPRVLMLPSEGGWSLPHFQPDKPYYTRVGHINQAMQQQLGIAVTTLRCARFYKDGAEPIAAIFVMESHEPSWSPPEGACWVGRDALAALPLIVSEHREVVEEWFAEEESGTLPALCAPWARRGWFGSATSWIGSELSQYGYTLVAPVEQFKLWGISSILLAHTSAGDIYFKAIPTLFAQEPTITQALSKLYSAHVPKPLALATYPDQSWMLLRDFGSESLQDGSVAQLEEALTLYSHIQIDSTRWVNDLLKAGCLDASLDWLASQIDPLMSDDVALFSLDEAEVRRLRALAPRLKTMCDQLANYNLPPTVVHGDFHVGNIAVSRGSYIFYDWSDGRIAHPFLDLVTILDNPDFEPLPPKDRTRLRDAYLRAWTAYEPFERLVEAAELAEPLGALQQAVSYQHIYASLEASAKHEMTGASAVWLRCLLQLIQPLS